MAFRWIRCVAFSLALSSCSAVGFDGSLRQFSGVWLYEFEGSTFIEGSTGIPNSRPLYEATDWLEWTDWPQLENLMEDRLSNEECNIVQPFLVTFVGRRRHNLLGGAGHLGLWRSRVTVQRPISAQRLGPSFCYADQGDRRD
jgi:hypothetical protein